MRKFVVIIFALALVPAIALAKEEKGKHGHNKNKIIKELGLDKKQVEQMQKIRLDTRRSMIKIHSEIDLKRLDFEEELQKKKPNRTKLDELAEELSTLTGRHEKDRLIVAIKMVEILTPEQKGKFLESKMGKHLLGGGGASKRGHGGHGDHEGKMP